MLAWACRRASERETGLFLQNDLSCCCLLPLLPLIDVLLLCLHPPVIKLFSVGGGNLALKWGNSASLHPSAGIKKHVVNYG